MKYFCMFVAVLMFTAGAWAKELPTNGVLLYRELSSDYVQAVRYSSFTEGRVDSVVALVGGTTIRVWNAGILANLVCPPPSTISTPPEMVAENIKKAQSLIARFPIYRAQIGAVLSKWEDIVQSPKKTSRVEETAPRGIKLQTSGVTYEGVTLTAVDLSSATISHSTGVANILLATLTEEQIAALNGTSKVVNVAPDWRVRLQNAPPPPPPVKRVGLSLAMLPNLLESLLLKNTTFQELRGSLSNSKAYQSCGRPRGGRTVEALADDYVRLVEAAEMNPVHRLRRINIIAKLSDDSYEVTRQGDRNTFILRTTESDFTSTGAATLYYEFVETQMVELKSGFTRMVDIVEEIPRAEVDHAGPKQILEQLSSTENEIRSVIKYSNVSFKDLTIIVEKIARSLDRRLVDSDSLGPRASAAKQFAAFRPVVEFCVIKWWLMEGVLRQ